MKLTNDDRDHDASRTESQPHQQQTGTPLNIAAMGCEVNATVSKNTNNPSAFADHILPPS